MFPEIFAVLGILVCLLVVGGTVKKLIVLSCFMDLFEVTGVSLMLLRFTA